MSEWNAALAVALLGLCAGAALAALLELVDPRHWRGNDRWRDPSPFLFRLLMPLTRLIVEHVGQPGEAKRRFLHGRLERAGMGYALLPEELAVLRWLTAMVALAGGIVAMPALQSMGLGGPWLLLGFGLLGYAYPIIWLRDQGLRRQRGIARQFPALLELLGLSVRAGLSFSAALPQCTAQLEAGPLRDEMQRVAREIRTGTARNEALERMAERIDLNAVHAFVAAIVQADETGAAISQTLSDQAARRRRERFAAAEKKANEAPVRMLLPLVGLLFPVTFLIIGFPIALQFLEGGLL
ncbi:type II secretion system F family protein [Spiribacter onubensis]|uniref:Type II secretion system F family protein n=1 Tax=Spiribacter onubensis TaxID=3122420 RepID=A0ABV3S862_9GAMM